MEDPPGSEMFSQTRGSGGVYKHFNSKPFIGEGEDLSRKWPTYEDVREKKSHLELPHTRKLFILFGSKRGHRSQPALEKRESKRIMRCGPQQRW